MRFTSRKNASGQVFAVAGTNTVSFGVVAAEATKAGLLGFAVERLDLATGTKKWVKGFKVFASLIPEPAPTLQVSTRDHPVQSFSWDDFTAAAGHDYRYTFHPVKGRPAALELTTPAMAITVRTEPLVGGVHDVFFNRGVASSQAYVREFGTDPIDKLPPARRRKALDWLSRDLDDAVLRFVDACAPGDQLLGCFYEFRYEPMATALVKALDRGVEVSLVIDAKVNEHTDRKGTFFESFPRAENLRMLDTAHLPPTAVILREARKSAIQHNKFMVRIPQGGEPAEVWTGSTNLSLGGIAGQTNVGHWVRDPAVAAAFARYWELLATDPGGQTGDNRAEVVRKNAALRASVEALSPVPTELTELAAGTIAAFSPRKGVSLLDAYAVLLDSADRHACLTLAFGISSQFKELLRDNTPQNQLVFLLLEKQDKPDPDEPGAFVRINASNNVYQAWGSFLQDPVYELAETNAGRLGLNDHVSYIHSKFMLIDPLSADPIVVTGSANFSEPSTSENDENMLLIRGDRRVADIYLTEFNRLFNHYYFRSVVEQTSAEDAPSPSTDSSRFLAETDEWLGKYTPGSLRSKRLELYRAMTGFTSL